MNDSVHPVDYLEQYIRINFGEKHINKEYLDQLRAICDEEVDINIEYSRVQTKEQAMRIGQDRINKLYINEGTKNGEE